MTPTTTTLYTKIDRPEVPKPAPLLRNVAQRATGLSAGFDMILRTELDAGQRDPGARPEPTEKGQPRPSEESSPSRDDAGTASQGDPAENTEATGQDEGAGSTPVETGNPVTGDGVAETPSGATTPTPPDRSAQTPATATGPNGGVVPQSPDATGPVSTPTGQVAEDAEAERRFIDAHGKRAATLRWDSVGVELTHAAEVDLADQNAQKLASRATKSSAGAGPSEQKPGGLTSPANPWDAAKAPSNKGQPGDVARESNPTTRPNRAATEPATTKTPEAETNASAAAVKAVTSSRATTSTAPLAAAHAQASRTEGRSGAAPTTGRGDLIARLGSINGQMQSSVASKSSANAVDGITRTMLRTQRADKPQVAAPASKNDKNETVRQVQQGLARLIKSSGGQSTIRLTPKSLGDVTVRLDIREGVASARFTATNDVARSLLQSGLKELHAALETRGIRVERLSVDSEMIKTPTESVRHEARAEPQASRSGEQSSGSSVTDRPEAETGDRGQNPGFAGQHPGQGRRDDSSAEASTRSVEALGTEPLPFDEPAGHDEAWIRLDTVA